MGFVTDWFLRTSAMLYNADRIISQWHSHCNWLQTPWVHSIMTTATWVLLIILLDQNVCIATAQDLDSTIAFTVQLSCSAVKPNRITQMICSSSHPDDIMSSGYISGKKSEAHDSVHLHLVTPLPLYLKGDEYCWAVMRCTVVSAYAAPNCMLTPSTT